MGQLNYTLHYDGDNWTAYVEINYSITYDPGKRESTVTFAAGKYGYGGRKGYGSTANTAITVSALDGGGSATANMNTSHSTGDYETFDANVTPQTVTVKHAGEERGVKIAGSTSIFAYRYSNSQSPEYHTGKGEQEERDYPNAPGTGYRLKLTQGEHTTLTVTREEQPLSDGAELSDGDELTVTYSADEGWTAACTVNGGTIQSGGTHKVAGNVTIVTTATQSGGGGGPGGKYVLHLKASPNAPITVMREGEALSDGVEIAGGDVLTVSFTQKAPFRASCTVNGQEAESGSLHIVSGDVTVETTSVFEPEGPVHRASVRLDERGVPDRIHLVQFDRVIPYAAVELWYQQNPWPVPEGAEVNVRMKKPDGKPVYDPALGLSDDRTVVYLEISGQMTAAPGVGRAILEIVKDTGVLGTAPLDLEIDRNPVDDGDIESSGEFRALQDFVAEAEGWAKRAEEWALSTQHTPITGDEVLSLWGSTGGDPGGGGSGGGTGGVSDHRLLTGRDAADQHPVEAISGLEELAEEKISEIWNGGN